MKDDSIFYKLDRKKIQIEPHLTNWGKTVIFLTAFFCYPIAMSLCFAFYKTDKEVALWYYKGVKVFGYVFIIMFIVTFLIVHLSVYL